MNHRSRGERRGGDQSRTQRQHDAFADPVDDVSPRDERGTMPKLGMDDSRPADARSSPRSACSVGMRNAAPLMNTLAHSVAASAMTSIDQRRAVLIDSMVTAPIFA